MQLFRYFPKFNESLQNYSQISRFVLLLHILHPLLEIEIFVYCLELCLQIAQSLSLFLLHLHVFVLYSPIKRVCYNHTEEQGHFFSDIFFGQTLAQDRCWFQVCQIYQSFFHILKYVKCLAKKSLFQVFFNDTCIWYGWHIKVTLGHR